MKTVVVMPSYNSELTFKKTILDLPFEYIDEIVFVDDASKDNAVPLLKKFCDEYSKFTLSEKEYTENQDLILITIHTHSNNKGYGANQKSCYDLALKRKADIIIMIHPDYQYDPKLSKYFVEYIKDGYFDMMLGSRIRSRKETLAGGMPIYKYYANRILSLIENLASGYNLSEWHSGMRAYKKEVLENIDYKNFSNDFIFDTQTIFSVIEKGYRIGDIPVPVRYFKDASSINFKRSFKYGVYTIWEVFKFLIKKFKNNTTLRYIFSGTIALLANLLVLFILVEIFDIWYLTATIISYLFGLIVSYLMQKFFTFKNNSFKNVHLQFLLFFIFNILMLGFNTALMYLFVDIFGFWYIFSQIMTTLFIAFINFYFFKRFFNKKIYF